MALKKDLDTKLIYDAVFRLCVEANTYLPKDVYEKLREYECKHQGQILQNAHLAEKKQRPLCQDTGQVVVFLDIGQDISICGEYIEDVINKAVADCYKERFYRKSIVKDALFERTNTGDNTPVIIHTSIKKGDVVEILLALKGGGAENTSQVKMFNPTASHAEIIEFIAKVASDAGENACPPMSLGIGVGGTIEQACLLAKRALYFGDEFDIEIDNVFETKILTSSTHIASLPVCVNTNCHSARHAKCSIVDGEIIYESNMRKVPSATVNKNANELATSDIYALKSLKKGENILLSGVVYTMRDAAHKRLVEMIESGKSLPLDLKDIIIFYAGPCPGAPNEIIGPIGPTTSRRMDAFAKKLFLNGLLGAIGKGEREIDAGLYFKLTGGVASLVQECVKKSELVAFEELGTEAIYRLEVEKLPLEVAW